MKIITSIRFFCLPARIKTILCILAVMTACAASINIRAASSGALDLSFGTRGTAAINSGDTIQHNNTVLIQSDGKVVLAGSVVNCNPTCGNSDFLVVRFNADGSPDNSFGANGKVSTDFFGQIEAVKSAAVQADGKIVVAGGVGGTVGGGQYVTGFKLVRYLLDGSLDTTFGTAGRVYESFNDLGGIAQKLIVLPDGKIIVSGSDGISTLFIARFNPNGSLDTSFGTNGRVISNTYDIRSADMLRQTDGKLIIVSSTNNTVKLIRFSADGAPDSSFGSGGTVNSSFNNVLSPTVALQTDGKILLSGAYNESYLRVPALRRFNTDGSVDASLVPNHGEIVSTDTCRRCTQKPSRVLLLPDGKFYLVGYNTNDGTGFKDATVSRYLNNGTIDSSFGFRGTSFLRYSNTNNYLTDIVDAKLQSDGKIVVAGRALFNINNSTTFQIFAMRINPTVTPPSVNADFDGDGKTDFAVYRPSTRFWYSLNSSDNSIFSLRYGADGDILTAGDYNYDKKTDVAVFRPSAATWYISPSQPSGGGNPTGQFGQNGDLSLPGDYDGDGYTDFATFRPSNGTWTIRYYLVSQDSFTFGLGTDRPVPADYDGDGITDVAVFRPSNGYWYISRSSDGGFTAVQFGLGTDKLVPADYDGDRKADVAVFRDGNWYILKSSNGGFVGVQWGFATDKPVAGDYDGDGKTDIAVFRPDNGCWYILKSSDSSFAYQYWGASEDIPIPFTFVR